MNVDVLKCVCCLGLILLYSYLKMIVSDYQIVIAYVSNFILERVVLVTCVWSHRKYRNQGLKSKSSVRYLRICIQ